MKLLIEGWRNLPQSFSVVNQFQCLELRKRREIQLYHQDAPFPPLSMLSLGRTWQQGESPFRGDAREILSSLDSMPPSFVPDVTYRIFFPSRFSAGKSRRTFVFCVTESGPLKPRMIEGRRALQSALAEGVQLVTPSAWSKEGLLQSGVREQRISVVPHGVDPDIYFPLSREKRRATRTLLNWNSNFVFLNVSNLYPWKGTLLLMKAFAVVSGKHAHARLLLKGSDDIYSSRRSLDAVLSQLSERERNALVPRLIYSGKSLSFEEVAELYQTADALVCPYLAEGFNLPALESLACGLPVICTAGGPTDEFLPSDYPLKLRSRKRIDSLNNSYQLEPDLDHLIEQMNRVIENSTLLQDIRNELPEHTHSRYSWSKVTDRLLAAMG